MKYFYAPIFEDSETHVLSPGETSTGEILMAGLVSGMSMPVCDQTDKARFVVLAPDTFVSPDGWVEKTQAEVIADYPQLGV